MDNRIDEALDWAAAEAYFKSQEEERQMRIEAYQQKRLADYERGLLACSTVYRNGEGFKASFIGDWRWGVEVCSTEAIPFVANRLGFADEAYRAAYHKRDFAAMLDAMAAGLPGWVLQDAFEQVGRLEIALLDLRDPRDDAE